MNKRRAVLRLLGPAQQSSLRTFPVTLPLEDIPHVLLSFYPHSVHHQVSIAGPSHTQFHSLRVTQPYRSSNDHSHFHYALRREEQGLPQRRLEVHLKDLIFSVRFLP
jgi:hypothetical protein